MEARSQQGTGKDTQGLPEELMGEAIVTEMILAGVNRKALLDTESMLSIIREEFISTHSSDLTIEPISEFISIEWADGDKLPYSGYVICHIEVEGLTRGYNTFPFLLVPSTPFSRQVLVLLGTNVLRRLKEQCMWNTNRSLQAPWWLASRCISFREQQIRRGRGRVGILKCAVTQIICLQPHAVVSVPVISSDKVGKQFVFSCSFLQVKDS